MFRKYAQVLRLPGAAAFSAVGMVARLPISMFGLGTILLVSTQAGSYALAGQVSAAVTAAGAVGMPQVAKLVDRYGQARVIRPAVLIGGTAWALLAVAVMLDWPLWTWFAAGMVGGATGPSIGSLVRARWMHLLGDRTLQQRAFSWESAIDEVVFMLGPPLATFLATGITPWAGVAAALGILVVGGWTFTALTSTEPPPAPHAARVPTRRLATPAFIVVCLISMGTGIVFGSVDIIVVAFAEEAGRRAMAGVILATWAAGSLVAGLTFGVLRFRRSVGAQLVVTSVAFSLLVPLLLLSTNLVTLGLLCFLTGLAIAPVLISATIMVERLVPSTALTEALTWSGTSIVIGVTIGAGVGGTLVDRYGAHPSFWLSALAALSVGMIAVVCHPLLRGDRVEHTARTLSASLTESPVPGFPGGEVS